MDCEGVNLANTSYLYARFTQTVLCGQMIQESIQDCNLSEAESYFTWSKMELIIDRLYVQVLVRILQRVRKQLL